MSFAPGEGASDAFSMLARIPVLLQSAIARMSSMARSKKTIDQAQPDVNSEAAADFARLVLATHFNRRKRSRP
jgi:hypothetical protein